MIRRTLIINIILFLLIVKIPLRKEIQIEEQPIENEIIVQDVEVEEQKITSRSSLTPRVEEQIVEEDKTLQGYRITSYYPGDNCATGSKTGSGKTTNDFTLLNVDGKNVYAYQGRIVVAGATKELLKSGYNVKGSQNSQNKHYFKYNDTGRIKINGNWYGFIVLDSCGAAMWEGQYRLDIFVPNSQNVIDTKNVEIIYD